MNIYVVRHGQTDWNLKNLLQGSSDIHLNNTGINEAKITAENLKDIQFSAIYSSPLDRALQTAISINKYHNLEIITDSRLIERTYGIYEGTSVLKNISDYWDLDLNLGKDNIENVHCFFNRIYDFLLEKYELYNNKDVNILIVTHNGVNIAIDAIINDIKKDLISLVMKNCDVKIFKNIKLNKKEYLYE